MLPRQQGHEPVGVGTVTPRLLAALTGKGVAAQALLPSLSSMALSLGTTSAKPGRSAGASAQQSLHGGSPQKGPASAVGGVPGPAACQGATAPPLHAIRRMQAVTAAGQGTDRSSCV